MEFHWGIVVGTLPWDEYPGRWRGGQTGRDSAWPWCHVGLPVEYAGSYQQDCFGLLLPSPQDSTTSTLLGQGRSTKTRISSCVVEDRLLQCRTRRTTCVFTGSSPASHQRRCSLRCQSPTSRPCQPCSARSTLAPNPWANIIQGVSHDVQHRQWNSADIHDWHGHAHFRSSRSVSLSGRVWYLMYIYHYCVHWLYTRYYSVHRLAWRTSMYIRVWYDMAILETRSVSRSGDRTLTDWTIIRSHVTRTRSIGEILVEMMIYSMSQWLINSMNIFLTKHLLSMSSRFETIVTQLQYIGTP